MRYKLVSYQIPKPTKAGACRHSCPFHMGWTEQCVNDWACEKITDDPRGLSHDHEYKETYPGPLCPWGKKEK